jgi:myo-inositol-1(or 4)-monophosphatase
MHPLVNIAINAARQAGDLIVRSYDLLDRVQVSTKHNNELFTDIDVKAEQIIIKNILKAYPSHGYIAEESGTYQLDSDTVWLIDPIDGTNNFIHGYPVFAVSIACKIKNRIEHGVVFDPLRQECFSASRGQGAQLNDRKIRVTKMADINSSLIGWGLPARNVALMQQYSPLLLKLMNECAGMRRMGSAALELCYVASGRTDGACLIGLKPWDIAAGALIVKEAGGIVVDFDTTDNYLETGKLLAGNAKIIKQFFKKFMEKN